MKLAAVALVFLATGCPLLSTTKRQVGLVPAPRPTMYDGQRMQNAMRVEGRASTVIGERPVTSGDAASEHSAYVARDTLGGGVFGMMGESELGVSFDSVRSRHSAPLTIDAGVEPPLDEDGYTITFSARRSLPLDNGWSVGIAGDLGWTKVPIVRDDREHVSDTAPLFRAAIVPSYQSGPVTLFASLQLTNDIVVPELVTGSGSDAEASAGGAAVIPTVGASVRVGGGVKLTTQVARPYNTPVEHGPQLELSLGYEFGDPPAR